MCVFFFAFCAGTWGKADFSTGLGGAAAGGRGEDARGDVAALALRRRRAGVFDMTESPFVTGSQVHRYDEGLKWRETRSRIGTGYWQRMRSAARQADSGRA